jgi:UDP-N-acetylglucosamine--N-acetylmuramyl-(pentapeptide) pyrophosphoryl-undecaprenol N-acetylglucosamine transferase
VSGALRVLLTGGGTGGHVYPALAVVDDCARRGVAADFRYVGTANGIEREILAKTSIPFDAVPAGAIRGKSLATMVAGAGRIVRGVTKASQLLRRARPHVVLATGGFVCVPVVVAARLRRVPVVVYLPDLRPGWAVRFLARLADAVAVSFDEVVPRVSARRVVPTGYPVRGALLGWTSGAAREALHLPDAEPVALVLGGSRGARSINNTIVAGAARLVERAVVVHVTGQSHFDEIQCRLAAQLPAWLAERYRVYPYLDAELAPALAASTVVVSRAGASTLGELPAVGAVGVLVPYPYAGAHQHLNAAFLAQRGAAIVVEDAELPEGRLIDVLRELIGDPARCQRISLASRELARPDAAQRLFELLEDVARPGLTAVQGGRLA